MSAPTVMSPYDVFRNGIGPLLPTAGLKRLLDACKSDDRRLVQGSTTVPPPLLCVADWPVEASCAIGFCGWQGDDLKTVGEVEEFFARVCFEADLKLGEPASVRWYLNWFDDTPRQVAIPKVGEMVEEELRKRGEL